MDTLNFPISFNQLSLTKKLKAMINKAWEHYKQPTPVKWRKIGDAILLGTASLSTIMMGAPISESQKTFAIFLLNVVGVLGKVITNFFKDEEAPELPAPSANGTAS
jgi:hypothetical protein